MKLILSIAISIGLIFALSLNATDFKTSVQQKLDQLKRKHRFPGATLTLITKEQINSFITGVSNIEKGTAMTGKARMFSGSVGKTYVAAVTLKLAEAGKIELDRAISHYLKGNGQIERLPNYRDITVRMLMNHTSGIPEHVLAEKFNKQIIKHPDKQWKPIELIAFILDTPPLFKAGQGWAYADTNYIVLGMIIEKVSKKTFYTLLKEMLLTPLHLSQTTPSVGRDHPNLISGYTGPEPFNFPTSVIVNRRYIVDPQFEWTGGGLISNSRDLALWAKLLYSGNVLKEQSTKAMLSAVSMETGKADKTGYGLGVQIWETPYGKAYGHGGIFPGYQTVIKYFPKYDTAIALQVNEDRTRNIALKNVYDFADQFMPIVAKHENRKKSRQLSID